jgi:hypothetical protein
MSTVHLAPGVEVPVTGKPFGDTPALGVDHLRRRMTRKARNAVVVLVILAAAAFGIFWHVGEPFWGNWPQVDAQVTSQYEYEVKGVRCSLGLDYVVDGQRVHGHYSMTDPCDRAPVVGSTVRVGVAPDDHGWVFVAGYRGLPSVQLLLTGLWLGFPLSGWAVLTVLAIGRLRRVLRLGTDPWWEVTGAVRSAVIKAGGLFLELGVEGAPDVAVRFGTRGISFFPIPTAGSTFTLRLVGDGSGKVLVGIPGHWGESLGLIWPAPARALAADSERPGLT